MKKRVLIIAAIVAALAIVSITVWQAVAVARTGTLEVTVLPDDAKVAFKDGEIINAGLTRLAPGDHTLEISREGFKTSTITVTIEQGKHTLRELVLEPDAEILNDPDGDIELPEPTVQEQREAERLTGKIIHEEGDLIKAANPILSRLPYLSDTYRVDFGLSQKHPNKVEAVALYITIVGPSDKEKAHAWLRSQGFNPAEQEIIFIYDDGTARFSGNY